MTQLTDLYRSSLALLTDLYQLTMAYGYWKAGVADQASVFHLHFRRHPFGGGHAVAAGLGPALDYLASLRFEPSDCDYLATLRGGDGRALFEPGFVDYLAALRFTGTIDAIPEGRLCFAHEPLVRVRAPIALASLIETPLLTMINFGTLIATKAARVCQAARGAPVLEFGLRRAQGIDGGLSASRAAWIGGCAATSNVLAGKLWNLPVRGTHAHSWVMFWGEEARAFAAYVTAMPGNAVLLVDTFDTLAGVDHAIAAGRALRARGHELQGVRLDSGDLAHLSMEARARLDAAGFTGARIVASNDLDERLITSLREQGARIDTWGVGTKLVTGDDQPALGGVYKLGAVADGAGGWRYPIKLSEQPIKISTPGIQAVRRFRKGGLLTGDIIYDALGPPPAAGARAWDLDDPSRNFVAIGDGDGTGDGEDVMVTVMRDGQRTGAEGDLAAARARCAAELATLSPRTRRFDNPQPYPVGLDRALHERKRALVADARAAAGAHLGDPADPGHLGARS